MFFINPFAFASAFSPADLLPELWLDASDTSTITESGGAVSQWDNKGSLGNFIQATGAVQPTTGASTLNGLNVIDFAADYLTADDSDEWKFLHDGTQWVLAMVAKIPSGGSGGYFGNNLGSGGSIRGVYYYSPNTSDVWLRITTGSGSAVFSQPTSVISSSFVIHSSVIDPDNGTAADRSEMFFNGGTANKNNGSGASPSSTIPSHALQIGAIGDDEVPLTGSIAEIVILSGANATESNRAALRDYLNNKWAVY